MYKTIAIFIAFFFSLTADVQAQQFTPCQYKNTYKYYISQGDKYMADNQLESALESYKRALIVQPNSEEARSKLATINWMLSRKPEARLTGEAKEEPVSLRRVAIPRKTAGAREEAVERAIKISEEMKGYKLEGEKKAVTTQKREPTYTAKKSTKSEAEVSRQEKKVLKPELVQRYPPAPKKKALEEFEPETFNEYYDEYIDPIKFNNGVNDKLQEGASSINSGIAPSKVTGEYRICLGATEDDFIWKDANADYHNMPNDTSWRYIFGQDRHNSYDKKVYSRLRVDIENPITDKLNSFNEIIIDPWTFVGKKRVYVTGSAGDNVQMDLKYWSNVSRTINETYRTEKGDIVNVQEGKVHDGKRAQETYRGLSDWGLNSFTVPELEIDRMYVPLRKSWIEYKGEPSKVKLFFMASQDEALTSDDPMRLSNNKVWWEESSWLDTYEPSRVFQRRGRSGPTDFTGLREPLKKGQWVRNQSFVARDSEDQRLTFLRGGSFDAVFKDGASIKMVAATPRNLWDRYDQATSLPLAVRAKTPINEKLTLGGLYTLKTGFRHNSAEAFNNLFAIDGSYALLPNTELLAEGAVSNMDVEESSGYNNDYTGYGAMVGLKNEGMLPFSGPNDKYELKAGFTHMDDKFFPGLSTYRFTRKEFEFAKHIYFDELRPENEAVKIGDGVDVGRNSFNITTKAEFPDQNADARFDFRTVHSDGWGFIENVYRAESTYKATPKLTLKGLAYYQQLPKTKKGIDPLINAKSSYTAFTDYFAYEDVWLENTAVPAGKDPSIGSFSAGLKYDFCDYFSGIGIYEATNDPKDWPRGLLNNTYVSDSYKDGIVWDKVVPFLYDQSAFGEPAYGYYSIAKTKFIYYPFEPIKVTLNYVYNQNKYAMAIDDNSTHQGVEVEYKPDKRLTLGFLYQYTRQRDVYKEFPLREGKRFDGHHNIFGALDYDLNDDQHLTLMFGEYVGYSYVYPEEHSALTALDTRHIVKVVYSGSWGEPKSPRLEGSAATAFNPLGELNPTIPGAKFVTNLYGAGAKYKERADIADIESDWDSSLAKLDFGIEAYDKECWEGALKVGLLGSFKEEESWNRAGAGNYQNNDMQFRGADADFNFGYVLPFASKYLSFTPLLNAGYRRIEFERSNFTIRGTSVPQLGEVDETFNVSFVGIGGRIEFVYADRFNLHTGGYWAPLVYTTVNNDVAGRLTSDGGAVLHADGGCDYSLSEKFDINIGGFWDLQHINRAQRINNGIVSAELPDNKLETFGLILGGSYRF